MLRPPWPSAPQGWPHRHFLQPPLSDLKLSATVAPTVPGHVTPAPGPLITLPPTIPALESPLSKGVPQLKTIVVMLSGNALDAYSTMELGAQGAAHSGLPAIAAILRMRPVGMATLARSVPTPGVS